jgi:hypothetical protein
MKTFSIPLTQCCLSFLQLSTLFSPSLPSNTKSDAYHLLSLHQKTKKKTKNKKQNFTLAAAHVIFPSLSSFFTPCSYFLIGSSPRHFSWIFRQATEPVSFHQLFLKVSSLSVAQSRLCVIKITQLFPSNII